LVSQVLFFFFFFFFLILHVSFEYAHEELSKFILGIVSKPFKETGKMYTFM